MRHMIAGAALACLAAGVAACSNDAEDRYREAAARLEEAEAEREETQREVQEKEQELAELRSELAAEREELAKTRARLERASSLVEKRATDAVIFRTLQREYLDEDDYEDAAIGVQVRDGVVTLGGTVPGDEVRAKAVELARDRPGVARVVDQLQVMPTARDGDGNAEAPRVGQAPPPRGLAPPARGLAPPAGGAAPSPVPSPAGEEGT